jgi:hypothetical protein
MTELALGVIDVPHLDDRITTGDLAEILEAKYDLFRGFYEIHAEEISNVLAESLEGALEDLTGAGHVPEDPYYEGCERIREMFQKWLDTGEVESAGLIGVPTQAALKGINHRKSKFQRGARRPSFEDTMILRDSLSAWVEK